MNKNESITRRIEGYEMDIEFLENDIKSSMEDLLYNKKQLSESTSIRDIEYYIDSIQKNISRIKELESKKSMEENFLKFLKKIKEEE